LSKLMRLLVDKSESPFSAREIPTLGIHQGHLGEMVFDDCRVPAENVMGNAGDAARILTLTWLGNRPLLGMAAAGMAQRALDRAIEYAGGRKQFGKAIAGHQLIQERLVDIEEAILTSRLISLHALASIDAGERANKVSAMAKRHAVQACEKAISSAMHVFGAMGVSTELGLEQSYRDIRMLPIPDGTYEVLTLIAGREITGIPAYRA
jgi:alkylation response protein AidB-like acyl-CoA dehydrogenase